VSPLPLFGQLRHLPCLGLVHADLPVLASDGLLADITVQSEGVGLGGAHASPPTRLAARYASMSLRK
jgi:hypothetical protein